MTFRVVILPNMENRENFQKIWQSVQGDNTIDVEEGYMDAQKTKAVRCQKNGVFEESQKDGSCKPIANESIDYIIHPDSNITQADIDKLPDNYSFGNGMSTFNINGKSCTIIVLQKDKTLPLGQIKAKLITDIKRQDKM